MMGIAEQLSFLPGAGYFGPARVVERDEETGRVRILLGLARDTENIRRAWATPAMPHSFQLKWGDTVLAAGDNDNFYIIGILKGSAKDRLTLTSGAMAEVAESPEEEKLKVYSKEGGLIFEYDAKTGKSRVDIPAGDLEFVAKDGNIDFISEKDIRFFSKNSIDLKSHMMGMTADVGEVDIGHTQYSGKTLSGRIDTVKLVMKRMETIAENMIETAQNVYRTVAKLSQLKTGRLRTLVQETSQFKSKKAFFKADEDFKIKGDKIHLG